MASSYILQTQRNMNELKLSTQISDDLNLLAAMVKTRSRAGFHDGAVGLESTAARFFNALFGWNLVNLNAQQANYPAADLGDMRHGIAIQITIQASSGKISDTQKKARKHELRKSFKELIIFFLLPEKPSFPRNFTQLRAGPKIVTWDLADILKRMSNLGDLEAFRKAERVIYDEVYGKERQLRKDLKLKRASAPRLNQKQETRATEHPIVMAKFQEENGTLCTVGRGNCRPYMIDLWINGASDETRQADFEILDQGFKDNPWSVPRDKSSNRSTRDFLTEDMNSWGDVAIQAKGRGLKGKERWFVETTLYEALNRFYRSRPKNMEVRRALKQIRDN
jgi:hypothetical protein